MIFPILLIVVVVGAWFVRNRMRTPSRAGARPEQGAVGWVAGTRWSVLAPLARVETTRILRHPAFLAGIPLTLFGFMAATSDELFWAASTNIALSLVLLAWMTIIAGSLTALRPARSGAAEFMAALPTPAPVRTAAHMLAVVGPMVVAAVLAIGCTIVLATDPSKIGSPSLREAATGVVLVLGGGVLGVAVAQWLPRAAFGIAAVVAVIFIQSRFLDPNTWPWNDGETSPVRFLAFFTQPTSVSDPVLEVRHAGWHLLYLFGLTVMMAGVALARHGRHRVVAGLVVGGVAVAIVTGWVQTRPPAQARVDAMVSYLTEPDAHQVCERDGSARYCSYPPFREEVPEWRAHVTAVLDLAPPPVTGRPLLVRQRVPTLTGDAACSQIPYDRALLPAVRDRVTADALWPDDGEVHPGLRPDSMPCSDATGEVGYLFLAVQTGAWAVGLPPAPHGSDVRCTADGQARSVAALWLGAAATSDGANRLHRVAEQAGTEGRFDFSGWDAPPMWGVQWHHADAVAAQSLLAMPVEQVTAVLHAHWDEVVDARTPAARLLELTGHESAPAQPGAPVDPASAPACE